MADRRLTVLITGASGFIGGAIAGRLIDRAALRSLTFHPAKNRFGDRLPSFAYDFDRPERMVEAFRDVDVFVNSYYIRFNHRDATFERAVQQTRALIDAARAAHVRKIVHVSVSNADERSDLPYYRNKGRIERLVRESGLEHTILRPAIVVGPGDILVNNIAFFLRHLPVFTVFGRGRYRTQPMMLEAFAEVAVAAIDGAHPNETLPLAGPSDWTTPALGALAGLKVAGLVLRDVVLTGDEVKGLTREYLYTQQPLRYGGDFRDWLVQDAVASTLGRRYESELARHFRP